MAWGEWPGWPGGVAWVAWLGGLGGLVGRSRLAWSGGQGRNLFENRRNFTKLFFKFSFSVRKSLDMLLDRSRGHREK